MGIKDEEDDDMFDGYAVIVEKGGCGCGIGVVGGDKSLHSEERLFNPIWFVGCCPLEIGWE